jgi:hypothetical protein
VLNEAADEILSRSIDPALIVEAVEVEILIACRLVARGGVSLRMMISRCGFLAFRSAVVSTGSSLILGGGT